MVTLSDQFGGPHFTKGGQGKLFSDPKPVDEHRYQRGYTPERMNEIRTANVIISTPKIDRRAQYLGSAQPAFGGPEGRRRLQEVIARSATPASDFSAEAGDNNPLQIVAGNLPSNGYASGTYRPGVKRLISGGPLASRTMTATPTRGLISLKEASVYSDPKAGVHPTSRIVEQRLGHTLLHELGHFRSSVVARNEHSAYDTPVKRGKEEAFADDNMVNRYRPDPRDVRRGTDDTPNPSYEFSGNFMGGLGGSKAFHAYNKARKTPLRSPQVAAAASRDLDAMAANIHLNNTQFFHRDYSEEGRTGKPAWQTNPIHMNAAARAPMEEAKQKRMGEAKQWLAANPDPPGWNQP